MDFLSNLTKSVIETIRPMSAAWGCDHLLNNLVFERPAAKGHGDLATNIAMLATKFAGHPPRKVAQLLIDELETNDEIMDLCEAIEIAGPGFINIFLNGKTLVAAAENALAQGLDFGTNSAEEQKSILLEFVSANPTGPLHVGHARYAAYGDSLRRILCFVGHQVETEFYINDYGSQMDTFGRSLAARYAQLLDHPVEFPEDGYQGAYPTHIAELIKEEIGESLLADIDPDLKSSAIDFFKKRGCELVLAETNSILKRFRIKFNNWFSESSLFESNAVHDAVADLAKAGELEVRDGAKWLLTSRYGDDKDRVLVRNTGEPTYFASDIAYHQQKLARGYDHLINIWGADHHGYVPRVKAAFTALSHDPEKLEIIIGQLVNVVEMGETKQMSKRAGTMVTLEELLQSIGIDAARFFLIDRSSDSTLDLDLEKAKLKSEENPVYYVQYAHARICSILKRADEDGLERRSGAPYTKVEDQERELILKLSEFPRIVLNAANARAPQRMTVYARELAGTFHVFYHNCPVIKAEPLTSAFRLDLCRLTRNVIARCLDLVGVESPERLDW